MMWNYVVEHFERNSLQNMKARQGPKTDLKDENAFCKHVFDTFFKIAVPYRYR
jgi:hypothetical protein